MRFIRGLKNLSKKKILFVIVILFISSWFLFALGVELFPNAIFKGFFLIFLPILAGFTFVLFLISFIIPLDKMGAILITISVVLTFPVMWIFRETANYFIYFAALTNIFITAFFAYKFCMDTSIKVDDYLYKKEGSRIFTRTIEFVSFFLLTWWLISLTIRFFKSFASIQSIADVFFSIFLIELVLIGIVVIRLLFSKRFAAYISFFNILIFFYVLYIIIDLLVQFIFPDTVGYDLLSFFIDFLLFIYIIGSIYERVDYIKDKLKIFRADTISLFIILMKLLVQIKDILLDIFPPPLLDLLKILIPQARILWVFFMIFTILIGVYTIFKHKEGKA